MNWTVRAICEPFRQCMNVRADNLERHHGRGSEAPRNVVALDWVVALHASQYDGRDSPRISDGRATRGPLILWMTARYARQPDNEGPRTPRSPTPMNDKSEPIKDHIRTL